MRTNRGSLTPELLRGWMLVCWSGAAALRSVRRRRHCMTGVPLTISFLVGSGVMARLFLCCLRTFLGANDPVLGAVMHGPWAGPNVGGTPPTQASPWYTATAHDTPPLRSALAHIPAHRARAVIRMAAARPRARHERRLELVNVERSGINTALGSACHLVLPLSSVSIFFSYGKTDAGHSLSIAHTWALVHEALSSGLLSRSTAVVAGPVKLRPQPA
jgi:hypothetical protein